MQAQDVFYKTPRGQREIGSKSVALSMRERRVLILIDGQRPVAQIKQMALVENFSEVIDKLSLLGLISSGDNSRARPLEPVADFSEHIVETD